MRKPRVGRVTIGQSLIRALRNEPGIEHPRLVVKALKAEEARTLRVCSVRLRTAANKLRRKAGSDTYDLSKANVLDHHADEFLHEAQALEKPHA